jgi:phosphatidylinositol N-acetylglucosaminyltransferase subunit Q
VENALKVGTLFRNAPHAIDRIYELCGQSSMHVLGLANNPAADLDPLQMRATTGPGLKRPLISCARASTIQIIMFERPIPNRMQYMSLNPISLALGDEAEKTLHPLGSVGAEEEKEEMRKWKRTKGLIEKLNLHTVVKHPPSQKELALPWIVNQINCSWEVHNLLQKNISLVRRRPGRSLSVSERVVESATTMRDFVIMAIWQLIAFYIYPVVRRAFIIILLGHRVAAEGLLLLLEWRAKPDYAALKDISATAQQVEIRLLQFCYWPMQYLTLRKRKDDWESITTSHPDYIRFYNSLWLVANDVIIGMALGSYIIDNSAWVAESISEILSTYTVAALQRTISWLMDWPAGLKLNNELATFLGDLFLWVIDHWSSTCTILCWHETSNLFRLYRSSATSPAPHHLVYRILKFRRRQYANCTVLRPPVNIDSAHILVLHSFGPNLQLAIHNAPFSLSTLPREEA